MDALRPDVITSAVKPAASEASEAAKGGKPFDEVMKGKEGGPRHLPQLEIREIPSLAKPDEARVQKLTAEKQKVAESAGGLQKLTTDLETGHARLKELVDQLQSRTYTPQELLGVQAEMHDIQVQIEVTTKVVAEATSSLRNLMQQQA